MDSDGNGIGDLPGITSKLDYLQSLGITALWLNPIYVSGWQDGGYDVIDFYQVDPRFGTNTDLVNLANELHKRGMKLCLDLVAGHTSGSCNQKVVKTCVTAIIISGQTKSPMLRKSKSNVDMRLLTHQQVPSEGSWKPMHLVPNITRRTSTRVNQP